MKNQYHYIVSIIVCTILFLSNASQLKAQNNPSEVVASFGRALSSWCNTNQVSYRERIDQLCSGPKKCRVEDVIHAEYQKGRGLTNYETFVLDSYLNMFQSLIPRSLNYKMSNVKVVGSDEMPDGTLTFITADITLSGTINKSVTDLFLVRNNKITGIYSYSSHMGFSHLNGSLIRALEQGRYQTGEYVNGYIFVKNEEGNLGLLDSKGDVIIPCVWHDMEFCGDFIMCYQYEPNNHHVCYDLRNLKRAPFRYCDVDASSKNNFITFFEGFASVLGENDKWGFLSENDIYYSGVEYVYDDASRFNDGYAYVTQDGINKIINKQFEIIIRDNDQYEIQGNFDEGLAPIKDRKNSKFGFVDKYGRIVISCRYEYVDSFSEGLCAVGVRINPNQTNNSRNWRYGYINKNGEKVIPTIYNFPVSFKNGHACVSKYIEAKGNGNEKNMKRVSSFISKDGRPLPGFDWEYHSIYEFQCGLARCEIGGKYGYIDMKGELVIPLTYTAARDFDSSGLAAVRNENEKWGCINKEGILVIPCIYEWVSGFYNGVAIAKKNDEIGLIDLYGNSTFNSKNKTQDNPINKTIDTDDELNVYNGHEYVDLGLSVMWATCNVGASRPEEFGNYYAWGEVMPKNIYNDTLYKWYNHIDNHLTKYCNSAHWYQSNGFVDHKTILDLSDDAACKNYGERWRMPTFDEWKELVQNCTFMRITINHIEGFKVTSKHNRNSIFLPAAGYIKGTEKINRNKVGYYWTRSFDLSDDYKYNSVRFELTNWEWSYQHFKRSYGLSIRPVYSPQ